MTKPESYGQAAKEQCVYLLVLFIPYYQGLFFAGFSGMLSFVLLTCLLMFVVTRSPAIYCKITERLKLLPRSWAPPLWNPQDLWISVDLHAFVEGPRPAPSFQRPPPLFS